MDTMKVIYKILEILDEALDDENFDKNRLTHESIGISEHKWNRIIEIMMHEGLVHGFIPIQSIGMEFPAYKINSPAITFKGLQYLAENSNMAKVINAAKLLKDTVPGF